ncbi:MAG: hypothetical protein U0R17_06880 [Acidimicrobiia bacterium]
MDITFLDDPQTTFTTFQADGITFKLFEGPELRSVEDPVEYVMSRIARCNGLRISERGLTVEFAPSFFEGHDTLISSGLDVGRDVTIHAHTSIGQGVIVGSDSEIGYGCTIEDHVTIGPGCKIGDENYIPKLVTIEPGVVIPPGTFSPLKTELITPAASITQDFVDRLVQGVQVRSGLAGR